jgi:hypothetical protein
MSDPEDGSVDPTKAYRQSYTEDDIQALRSTPRFLVAADAYGLGRCTLEQMVALAFTQPPYLPRNLGLRTFADLIFELVRRIKAGELLVPEEWKKEYSSFYQQQPAEPLDELPMSEGGKT